MFLYFTVFVRVNKRNNWSQGDWFQAFEPGGDAFGLTARNPRQLSCYLCLYHWMDTICKKYSLWKH
jgi:hypothetical protein